MTELAIDISNLSKVFDNKTVVDSISLQVKKGSIFGFLGSNGSGKTTTIRMICGLLTPSAGHGHCLGYDIRTQQDEIKSRISYMPQKFSLYNGLTVEENLQFFAQVYELNKPKQRIHQLLDELELAPYQKVQAGNLSGGWKQRMTLACCLLHQPALLFLDEPTAGVDPKARKDFWNYLHELSRRDGTTILVTTHYMDEAEKCTDLAYINLGRLLYAGTTKDLIPFSNVTTLLLLENDAARQNEAHEWIKHHYPNLLVSLINNDLRVSSIDRVLLMELLHQHTSFSFKEIPPSFEEVFIGLMH